MSTSEKDKIEEYLADLEDFETVDVIIKDFYRQNPEAFPTLEDVLSMASQVEEGYGEDDYDWPEDPGPTCCEFCRRYQLG